MHAEHARRLPYHQAQQIQTHATRTAYARCPSQGARSYAEDEDAGEEEDQEQAAEQQQEDAAEESQHEGAAGEERAAEQAQAEVFCPMCQQADDPAQPSRDYVACDKCEQWFHPECADASLQVWPPPPICWMAQRG